MRRLLCKIRDQGRIARFDQSDTFKNRFRRQILGSSHDVFERVPGINAVSLLHQNWSVVELRIDKMNRHAAFLLSIGQRPKARHQAAISRQERTVTIDDSLGRLFSELFLVELGSGDRKNELDLLFAQMR